MTVLAIGDARCSWPASRNTLLRVARHERRTSLTASLGCWHAYPVGVSAVLTLAPGSSPWRLQSAHGGTPAYVTDGDGRAGMRRAGSAVLLGALGLGGADAGSTELDNLNPRAWIVG